MTESLQLEAQNWWLALAADCEDVALQARFDAWLAADDAHRLAYLDVLLASNALDAGLAGLPEPIATDADADTPADTWATPTAAGSAHLTTAPGRFSTWKPWFAGMSLASALVLGVLALPLLRPAYESRSADWRTAPGLIETRTLDDGSQVQLGPDSAVRMVFGPNGREVELLRGELNVQVGVDPRPFLVRHQDFEIRDIGTRFWVDESGDSLRVAVSEGEVSVQSKAGEPPQHIVAGQSLEWQPDGVVNTGKAVTPELAPDVLVLDNADARTAFARFERYSGQRLQWLGDAGNKRFTAALPIRNNAEQDAAFVQLQQAYGVSVRANALGVRWLGANGG
ncbi:hypothetical protein C7S18_00655 [Ahniella affigens]|uniref:FecR protein domain-containing protein n=1 Tax=Ahniella affigens TaxID=2021234 RepID=A0A2P1PLS8_9GAMM|nr:FecR domain-containing protein [Ahniella affigens]AVP95797.1 hypothetical protein C7S18_00655 [Ahniella affigens]